MLTVDSRTGSAGCMLTVDSRTGSAGCMLSWVVGSCIGVGACRLLVPHVAGGVSGALAGSRGVVDASDGVDDCGVGGCEDEAGVATDGVAGGGLRRCLFARGSFW